MIECVLLSLSFDSLVISVFIFIFFSLVRKYVWIQPSRIVNHEDQQQSTLNQKKTTISHTQFTLMCIYFLTPRSRRRRCCLCHF